MSNIVANSPAIHHNEKKMLYSNGGRTHCNIPNDSKMRPYNWKQGRKDKIKETRGFDDANGNFNDIEQGYVSNEYPTAERNVPGEVMKFLISIVFLLFGLAISVLSLSLTHDRTPNVEPLPDIILDNLPYQDWALKASEYIILTLSGVSGIIVLFHKHRTIIARRICLLIGLHYIYRGVTFFLTVLPNPNENIPCLPPTNQTTMSEIIMRFVRLSSSFGFSFNYKEGDRIYCGDYIYSGHTVSLITAYLIIQEYSPKSWSLLHWATFFASSTGVIFILLERGHYSVDVLIAYWITTRVWWMFHTLAKNKTLKTMDYNLLERTTDDNHLKSIWWWHIFRYFEINVPHNLSYQFDWPLPQKLKNTKIVQYLDEKIVQN